MDPATSVPRTRPELIEAFTVARAANQLLVGVLLEKLEAVADGLTPVGPDSGHLTLLLPRRHLVEEIPGTAVLPWPLVNRAAGGTQLRFDHLRNGDPLHRRGALGWADRRLVLDPRGSVSGGPYPTDPPTTTSVELPQGLYLSPGPGGRFVSLALPRTCAGVTELWRMRLGRARTIDGVPTVVEPPFDEVRVRAIWTDEHEPTVPAADWDIPADEFLRLPTRGDQR